MRNPVDGERDSGVRTNTIFCCDPEQHFGLTANNVPVGGRTIGLRETTVIFRVSVGLGHGGKWTPLPEPSGGDP